MFEGEEQEAGKSAQRELSKLHEPLPETQFCNFQRQDAGTDDQGTRSQESMDIFQEIVQANTPSFLSCE